MTNLTGMKCVACEGGVSPMTRAEAAEKMVEVPGWALSDDALSIVRAWEFKDFAEAFAFLTKVAARAEAEGHHPEIWNSWNKVRLTLSTHSIGGLSLNDFILAAKINTLESSL